MDAEPTYLLPDPLPVGAPSSPTQIDVTVHYAGGRASVGGTLRITCNDPSGMIVDIPLQVLATAATYRIDPTPPVEVAVANTANGQGRRRLVGRCKVISVQTPAGRFRIYNTSDAPLFLCQSALDDPDGVFQVPFHPTAVPSPRFPAPFNPRTVLPQNYEEFIVYFFPTEVMKDYRAILTIRSNAGPITVPIHGRVETLPTVIQPGMLVDLVTDAMCIPPTTDLCKIRGIFEPVLTNGPVSIVDATFDGVPREAQLAFTDRGGTPQVWDRSGQTTRPFALEFAPPSDGGDDGLPGMPCIPTFHDLPAKVQELISLRVEGRLLDRVHVFEDLPVTSLAAADGWVYLGTAEGLHVLDWRDDRKPTRVKTLRIGEIHTLSLPREILLAAVGDEIVALNIRWPDNPLLIDAVRLSAPPTAFAASAEGAFAVDGRELYRIVHADNSCAWTPP